MDIADVVVILVSEQERWLTEQNNKPVTIKIRHLRLSYFYVKMRNANICSRYVLTFLRAAVLSVGPLGGTSSPNFFFLSLSAPVSRSLKVCTSTNSSAMLRPAEDGHEQIYDRISALRRTHAQVFGKKRRERPGLIRLRPSLYFGITKLIIPAPRK
jgi:hypothetical protein